MLLVIISCLLLLSCAREETPVAVDLSKRADISVRKGANVISYAYLPQYAHRTSFERHHPLIEYLKKETGLPIEQVFPDTFDEHMRLVGQGKIDISFSNPVAYVEMAQRFGAKAFARTVEPDGKAEFRGQIICRKDNESIRTIEDCRGKRWIAVDASSAGGYMFALGHFHDYGIRKEDFAEIAFAQGPGGKSEKVVLSVYAGKYDIGSVREGTLAVVADKIDVGEIRVIAHTRWYPGWVYAARKDLDPQVVEKIKAALLKLDRNNQEHRQIFESAKINAVIPSHDGEFNSIRDLLKKVGISEGG
ncbi:MAG TPA: phosphate/phosphite/phosphonate ABC transporter substrate-binding protein [Dissulfurispiraceae bacterium]|nr:phosphate/phosphite/phosphonate ABC transporter substrate-binding protein [Dissulfurispiraceae bacterium]